MPLFALEHSKTAYAADFGLYVAVVTALAAFLLIAAPHREGLQVGALVVVGWVSWTAVEYVLHRFLLHGVAPFSRWHAEHHLRPRALIYTPTILSAALIAGTVFVPAWAIGDLWRACALTLGFLTGNLAYAVIHHATHHWRSDNAWLLRRKRWHARHHQVGNRACYGVSSPFWDHVFGSTGKLARPTE
jgi:cyclopropane-fatty-acyl-phospholipid synthase